MPLALVRLAQVAIFFIAFTLSGCSGMRLVDARVTSFAPQPVAAGASYRFERLPSQQADANAQAHLEMLAEQALAKVGLTRSDSAPLSVQVSAVQRQESLPSYHHPHFGWGLGWVLGNGSIMVSNHGPLFPGLEAQPNYWRQVSLIMRDASQAVVFESHASHEGPWADSDAVLAAMLDAALQGFPDPPAGARQVNIEIPR